MTMNIGTGKSNHAAAAAMIRANLKKHGIKATVHSKDFAGGNSIDVRIAQDLTPAALKEINAYCGQFEYGSFDGMEDIYRYTNHRDDLPQVKYLHVYVDYSDAIRAEAAAYIANIEGLNEYERDRYNWMALCGSWGDFWTDRKPHVRVAL
jgi:hypothetical protein